MTEWELLLTLVRPRVELDRVHELVASGVDWEKFRNLAGKHDLRSFAASNLLSGAPDAVPATVREELRVHLMENTARQLRAEHELAALAAAFRSQGIPLLSFKGPTLARTLHGDASLREYGDLDILVRPMDTPAARELLIRKGYQTEFTGPNPVTAPVTRFSKEISFHQDGCTPVDLHWDLSAELMPSPLDVRMVWDRTGSVDLNGARVATLGLEDQIIYLCYHGGKHLWNSLSLVCDIGWSLARQPGLDYRSVLNLARESRCERLLLLGVRLAGELLDVTTPEFVARVASARKDVGAAADAIERKLAHFAEIGDTPPSSKRTRCWLLELPRQKARYVLGLIFAPTMAEWRAVQLPPALYWLYYPFRLVRLCWKYCRTAARRIGGSAGH